MMHGNLIVRVSALGRHFRFRTVALALIAFHSFGESAHAQDTYCAPCVDKRWESIGQMLADRAENLRNASEYLRLLEAQGSQDELDEARLIFREASDEWREIYATAKVLGTPSYRHYLISNLDLIETSRIAAAAELQRRQEQLVRLQNATGDQRARMEADLVGTESEELRLARTIALDAAINGVKLASVHAEIALKAIAPAASAANPDQMRWLNGWVELNKKVEFGKGAFELSNEEYWKSATSFAQIPLEALVGLVASRLTPAAILVGPIASLTLDSALLAQNLWQQDEVRSRLQGLDNLELQWQTEIARLTARAENLNHEGEVASRAIERQDAFERQLSTIQSELMSAELVP